MSWLLANSCAKASINCCAFACASSGDRLSSFRIESICSFNALAFSANSLSSPKIKSENFLFCHASGAVTCSMVLSCVFKLSNNGDKPEACHSSSDIKSFVDCKVSR